MYMTPGIKQFNQDADLLNEAGLAEAGANRYATVYGTTGKQMMHKRNAAHSQLAKDHQDMLNTSVGDEHNLTLPRINNSMDIASISEKDSKRRSNNVGSKSVD